MVIGYARVSRQHDQDTTAQLRALQDAGAERIFTEHASGGRWDRPELQRMMDQLRPGDVVTVWKLDRLSRSLKDLLQILDHIEAQGAGFKSLTEHVDTTTPAGRMLAQMLGAFAEFERAMIRERTRAGLEQARAEGRIGGRRRKLTQAQEREVVEMVQSGRRTAAQCARLFEVHPSTVTRLLQRHAPSTLPAPDHPVP
ncbi:recombinase family protein [Deinococcus sp. NW-56]|uniref:recombinase family protein n=1 Tax=Deinococcus sp. NW-56 TaxID=2080419 RepID=UPI000CF4C723|nr:recombinase family protein [Deinococcus sp. NW-56]